MKKLFLHPIKETFYEIQLDEDTFELQTKYGEFDHYYESPTHYSIKETSKKFKKLDVAQRNFDKKCEVYLEKEYVESNPDFPLYTQQRIQNCIKTKDEFLEVSVYHENNFVDFPKLKNLKRLFLRGKENKIAIPSIFAELESLEFLSLSGTIKSLPDNLGQLKKLKELRIYVDAPFNIPEYIGELANLETLRINLNQKIELPSSLSKLKKLKVLDAEFNNMQNIPEVLCECVSLEKIEFSRSKKFHHFPENIGNLKNLKVLELERCDLTDFPKNIEKIKSLEQLNLAENIRLKELPDEIGNLSNLKILDVSGKIFQKGRLKILPKSFFNLTQLEDLNLSWNDFKIIQEGFKKLQNLKVLNFEDNPIANMPKSLAYIGKEAIYMHFGWMPINKNYSVKHNLTEEEVNAIVTPRLPKLNKYLKLAKRAHESYNAQSVYDYLSFEKDEIPKMRYSYRFYENRIHGQIWKFFNPLNQWNEIDHRLMVMLAYDWGETNKREAKYRKATRWGEAFYVWYAAQIVQGIEPDYEDVLTILKKYGKDENAFDSCMMHLSEYVLRPDEKGTHQVTKIGQIILDEFNKNPLEIIGKLKANSSNHLEEVANRLAIFFFAKAPKTFCKYVEEWFFPENLLEECKTTRTNFFDIQIELFVLLKDKLSKKQYEALLLKAITLPPPVRFLDHERAALAVQLHLLDATKHRDLIIKNLKQSLGALKQSWTDNAIPLPNIDRSSTVDYCKWLVDNYKDEIKNDLIEQACEEKYLEYHIPYLSLLLEAYNKEAHSCIDILLEKKEKLEQVFPQLVNHDYSELHDKVWKLLESKELSIRKLASKELVRVLDDKEILAKIPDLINHKRMPQRDSALKLLMTLKDNKEAQNHLREIWKNEEKTEIREQVILHLQKEDGKFLEKNLLAGFESVNAKGKLKKRTKKWLEGISLPDLYWENGKKVDAEIPHYLFYLQKDKPKPWQEPSNEVGLILDEIDQNKSGDFAKQLLELCMGSEGLKASCKPVAAIFSCLGDEGLIKTMQDYCTQKNSVVVPPLIGNIGGEKAARALDAIMLHYRTKYPNIKNAASEAFDKIADELGVSRFELMDKMVPDFGFVNLFKEVDVAGEKWRAFINQDFKISYLDENDKIKKSLPKGTDAGLKTEMKNLTKEIREITKNQKVSLEFNLISQRRWDVAAWKKHFMGKPLTFAFAQTLVWGMYEDDKLIQTFGVNQDQTLEDVDYEEVSLTDNAQIGMIHPLELSDELLEQWQTYFADNKLTQGFEQLERKVFYPDHKTKHLTVIDYKGKEVSDYRFRSLMGNKRGWKRGSVVDSGMVANYKKSYDSFDIDVFITLGEMYIYLGDYSEEINVKDLFFVKKGSVETGSYVYDTYRNEDDSRLIRVKDLPPIVYSETMYDFDLLFANENT